MLLYYISSGLKTCQALSHSYPASDTPTNPITALSPTETSENRLVPLIVKQIIDVWGPLHPALHTDKSSFWKPQHSHDLGVDVLTAETITRLAFLPPFHPCFSYVSMFAHLSSKDCCMLLREGILGSAWTWIFTHKQTWIFSEGEVYVRVCVFNGQSGGGGKLQKG